MSTGGRWRLLAASSRSLALAVLLGGLAWSAWLLMATLRKDSARMPAAAKAVPVKPPELKTSSAGVLDNTWLAHTLALPPGIALIELDLEKLFGRLLADRQVVTAALTRHFPDRLVVHVTERAPVARVRLQVGSQSRDLLVARDGIVFSGYGYDPAMIETLPWLGGLALVPEGAAFRPIPRMNAVAQLLAEAQFSAGHLYRSWQIVSLAHLESDDEIEVTTKDNTTVVFGAKGAFLPQLAKLDYMKDYLKDRLAREPPSRIRIDLSLGVDVPVRIEPLAEIPPGAGPGPLFPPLFRTQSTFHREL